MTREANRLEAASARFDEVGVEGDGARREEEHHRGAPDLEPALARAALDAGAGAERLADS
jgi:hypothetical protein